MIKKFTIEKAYNCAVIQISRQTHMTIYDENGVHIFSDNSNTTQVSVLLNPGAYTVDTDGQIKSITPTKSKLVPGLPPF